MSCWSLSPHTHVAAPSRAGGSRGLCLCRPAARWGLFPLPRHKGKHREALPEPGELAREANVSPSLPQITGVSILRAGETMEQALTAVCKDIRLGKILIQTNLDTGEPEVSGPSCAGMELLAPQDGPSALLPSAAPLPAPAQGNQRGLRHPHGQHRVHRGRGHDGRARAAGEGGGLRAPGRGCAALPAPAGQSWLSVPQDHDVQEDRIFLLSLLMAEMGVHSVAYAFPRVHIITTAVDKRINEEFHIIPGIGEGGQGHRPGPQPLTLGCPTATLGGNCSGAGAAIASLCPLILQVTLGTDTLAPMALLPGVRATAWTAELAGHGATGRAGPGAGPCPQEGLPVPTPRHGPACRTSPSLPPSASQEQPPAGPIVPLRRDGGGMAARRSGECSPQGVSPGAGHPRPWGGGDGVRCPRRFLRALAGGPGRLPCWNLYLFVFI